MKECFNVHSQEIHVRVIWFRNYSAFSLMGWILEAKSELTLRGCLAGNLGLCFGPVGQHQLDSARKELVCVSIILKIWHSNITSAKRFWKLKNTLNWNISKLWVDDLMHLYKPAQNPGPSWVHCAWFYPLFSSYSLSISPQDAGEVFVCLILYILAVHQLLYLGILTLVLNWSISFAEECTFLDVYKM